MPSIFTEFFPRLPNANVQKNQLRKCLSFTKILNKVESLCSENQQEIVCKYEAFNALSGLAQTVVDGPCWPLADVNFGAK